MSSMPGSVQALIPTDARTVCRTLPPRSQVPQPDVPHRKGGILPISFRRNNLPEAQQPITPRQYARALRGGPPPKLASQWLLTTGHAGRKDDDSCPICYEPIRDDTAMYTCPNKLCRRSYRRLCIVRTEEEMRFNKCPFCRMDTVMPLLEARLPVPIHDDSVAQPEQEPQLPPGFYWR